MEGKLIPAQSWALRLKPCTVFPVSKQSEAGLPVTIFNFYPEGLLVLLAFSSISLITVFIIPHRDSYPRAFAHMALFCLG